MNYDFYQKPFPEFDLDDEYCLREQSLDDTSAFFQYYSEPMVSRYILASPPKNLTDAMNEIHYCRNMFHNKTGIYWAVARKSDNRMIGAIGLYVNGQHSRAEICYDLHKAFWRRGIMSRAIKKVIDFSFDQMKLHRLEAITVKENIPSMAILKNLGFVYEGTLHNYRQYENRAHDVELFGTTPTLYRNSLRQSQSQKETAKV